MATNQHLVEQAKVLYFQYLEAAAIAKKLDLPIEKINNWIHRGTGYDKTSWRRQRAELAKDVIQTVKDRNRVVIANIFKLGLPLIQKSLQERANKNQPLTIAEAKQVTEILMSFDKIERLEENKPTEIVDQSKNVSLEELRRVVLADPFVDIELKEGKDYGKCKDYGTEPINTTGRVEIEDHRTRENTDSERDPLTESGS